VTLKTAKLIRKYTPLQTNGVLIFGDHPAFTIKTIEKPDLSNRPMVSCIPEGQYLCKWSHMSEHNVDHYQLQNVKDRTAIFIHIAGSVHDVLGCIGSDRVSIGCLETYMAKEDFMLVITS
jgi:hypothetical protein